MSLDLRPEHLKRASFSSRFIPCFSAVSPHCVLWFLFPPEAAQEPGPGGPARPAAADSPQASTVHVLSQLLRLRQCCCHLSLLKSVRAAVSSVLGGTAGGSASVSACGVRSAGKWGSGGCLVVLLGGSGKRVPVYFTLFYMNLY